MFGVTSNGDVCPFFYEPLMFDAVEKEDCS